MYTHLNFDRRAEVISKSARRNDERFSHYKDNMFCEISRKRSFNEEAIPNHVSATGLATKGFFCGKINCFPAMCWQDYTTLYIMFYGIFGIFMFMLSVVLQIFGYMFSLFVVLWVLPY